MTANDNLVRLVVTQDGKAIPDQGLGVRLFKDASRKDNPRPYRITPVRGGRFELYHYGRRVLDTPTLREGAPSIEAVRNWLRAFYAARK